LEDLGVDFDPSFFCLGLTILHNLLIQPRFHIIIFLFIKFRVRYVIIRGAIS
jgi:hypothetical protein